MTTVLEQLKSYENFKSYTFDRPTEFPEGDAERGRIYYPLGDGPWNDEPDKVQWIDPATGYDCLIVRNHFGALCGYVGVPPEHPWFGTDYSNCTAAECHTDRWCDHSPEAVLSVHGGITFANFCEPGEPVEGICHMPAEGRPEVYWFGFDCAHSQDLAPGMKSMERNYGISDYPMPPGFEDVYRDLGYVVSEIQDLAKQLKERADVST